MESMNLVRKVKLICKGGESFTDIKWVNSDGEEFNDSQVLFDGVDVLKGLYDELEVELNNLIDKRNSVIEKSEGGDFVSEYLDEVIEKAVKDISKLDKIKKLIYRDGKLIFATYYVKHGEAIEDDSKQSDAGIIKDDISQGDTISLMTKKRLAKGVVCGFSFEPKTDSYWISIKNEENGKIEWFNSSSITGYNLTGKASDNEEYKVIKSLGGSTGALLVEDKYGNKYVKKTGKDKEHIDIEYQALKLYKYLGVSVPEIHKYDKESGTLFTKFIDQSTPIGSTWVSEEFVNEFAIDALLANWDVIGMGGDNVLVAYDDNYDKKYYRVDVGGSLTKRAQGENKEFGEEVKELQTMLDYNLNPESANKFKGVNLEESISLAVLRYNAAKKLIKNDDTISPEIKDILEKRVNFLKKIDDKKKAPSGLNYQGVLYKVNRFEVGDRIADFYDRLNKDLTITLQDEKILNSSYYTEEGALNSLKGYGTVDSELYKEAIEKGMTNLEIRVIKDYTGSSSDFNGLAKSYLDTPNGNINFNLEEIDFSDGEEKEVETIETIPLNTYYDKLLEAVKSLNHAKENGNSSSSMNSTKLQTAYEISNKLEGLYSETSIDPEDKKGISELLKIAKKFVNAYDSDTEVPKITKSSSIKTIQRKVITKVAAPSNGGYKINGFEGKNPLYVAKLKLLCHAVKKMEMLITNEKFLKNDQFNRGIDIGSSKEKIDLFKKQHQKDGQYVMHQWGSSSSWMSYGFAGSNNTLVKIVGKGVHINDISNYKSNYHHPSELEGHESEVLHRPFTMYRTISYQDNNENYQNKRTVALQKVDI